MTYHPNAYPTAEQVVAAVVNTSPVKAVHSRAWDIGYAVAAELRQRGMLAEPDGARCPHCSEWSPWPIPTEKQSQFCFEPDRESQDLLHDWQPVASLDEAVFVTRVLSGPDAGRCNSPVGPDEPCGDCYSCCWRYVREWALSKRDIAMLARVAEPPEDDRPAPDGAA